MAKCDPEITKRIQTWKAGENPGIPDCDDELAWVIDSSWALRELILHAKKAKTLKFKHPELPIKDVLAPCSGLEDGQDRMQAPRFMPERQGDQSEPHRSGTQGWMEELVPSLKPCDERSYYFHDLYCAAARLLEVLMPDADLASLRPKATKVPELVP